MPSMKNHAVPVMSNIYAAEAILSLGKLPNPEPPVPIKLIDPIFYGEGKSSRGVYLGVPIRVIEVENKAPYAIAKFGDEGYVYGVMDNDIFISYLRNKDGTPIYTVTPPNKRRRLK
jgi:hypothetical protein